MSNKKVVMKRVTEKDIDTLKNEIDNFVSIYNPKTTEIHGYMSEIKITIEKLPTHKKKGGV